VGLGKDVRRKYEHAEEKQHKSREPCRQHILYACHDGETSQNKSNPSGNRPELVKWNPRRDERRGWLQECKVRQPEIDAGEPEEPLAYDRQA